MSYRNADGVRKNAEAGPKAHARWNGRNQWGEAVHKDKRGEQNKNGKRAKRLEPSHVFDGSVEALANPGNVIKCVVGGNHMGHKSAHRNEAPFPLKLAEFFVKSFCPPGGLVCDPFSGSGTVAEACKAHGRRFTGCDIRQSQVDLTMRRLRSVTPSMTNEI